MLRTVSLVLGISLVLAACGKSDKENSDKEFKVKHDAYKQAEANLEASGCHFDEGKALQCAVTSERSTQNNYKLNLFRFDDAANAVLKEDSASNFKQLSEADRDTIRKKKALANEVYQRLGRL